MNPVRYLLSIGFLTVHLSALAQQRVAPTGNDTVGPKGHPVSPYAVDSFAKRRHDPRKATIRSAIFPGWGQIYNRKYWKLPIVWAAVGIPAYTYVYNRTWYRNYQQAISVVDFYTQQSASVVPDSALNKLSGNVRNLVELGFNQETLLRTYRNEFRKDEDYSVLFFLLFWGLNVVDATVDAHLMYFDVSDKLTLHVQQPSPGFMSPGSGGTGVSLVIDFHKARNKALSMR